MGQVVINGLAQHLVAYLWSTALFLDELGRPLGYRRWKRIWVEGVQQADVSFTTHAPSHIFASALISGGASVKQVQTVLGHASTLITLKV